MATHIKYDFSYYSHILYSNDLIQLMYSVYNMTGILFTSSILLWPQWMPQFMTNFYFYGQLNNNRTLPSNNKILTILLKVPKRFFTHFYTMALVIHLLVTAMIFWLYYTGQSVPYVVGVSDFLMGTKRKTDVKPVAVLVATTLFMCHIVRRFYESHYVSVYSDSHMNLLHYFVGITFYSGASCALLAQAPGFTRFDSNNDFPNFDWEWCELFGCAMYFWATFHQYKCAIILADLRKRSGRVTTTKHKIPFGDWFEYVSFPHYLAEILIYLSINIVLSFRNTNWILILLFTFVNQTFYAILKHRWYHEKFEEYPKHRKAIFPLLL